MADSRIVDGHDKDLPDRYPGNFIPSKSGRVRVHHLDHAGSTLFSEDQLGEAQEALSRLCINPHRYVVRRGEPWAHESRAHFE